MTNKDDKLDLASIRARLSAAKGKEYWRSLEELAETEGFYEMLHREFPRQASEWIDSFSRRQFLKLMGASLALAGLTACYEPPPEQKIVPYVRPPEDIVPGKPLFYATSMPFAGSAMGLLVESHMGRPTKIEGNPDHPASLGATDVFAQASVLTLYDPDRSQTLTYLGEIRSWPAFLGAISLALEKERPRQGSGLRILTETVISPTFAEQVQSVITAFPSAKWHQYDPACKDGARAGSKLAFGEYVDPVYNFTKTDLVLSLDADFLSGGPGHVRYTRDFAYRRKGTNDNPNQLPEKPIRLYVVESTPSNTGSIADHRLPLRPSEIESFARNIAAGIGVGSSSTPPSNPEHAKWIEALVKDLQAHKGTSLVIAGEYQSPGLNALAHAMNQALGNVGNTVTYISPVEPNPVEQTESLKDLVKDMNAGVVDTLIMIGGNPVYTAPADLKFTESLSKVALRIHLSLYNDETSSLSHWHIPRAHYLESWGDARAFDGTASIIQPLISPLYYGKTEYEVLAAFSDQPERTSYDIVRDYWGRQRPGADFEKFWRKVLHDGFIPETAAQPKPVTAKSDWLSSTPAPQPKGEGFEVIFRPDPSIHDGQFTNNPWLQELPKPLTKLTWDNAAIVSPSTAEKMGLSYLVEYTKENESPRESSEVVELNYQGRQVSAPVWILPGQADNCITVHLGYGRTRAGNIGTGIGFNAYTIRTSAEPWFGSGASVKKTGNRYSLACTQNHHSMEGRHLVRSSSFEKYKEDPKKFKEHAEEEQPKRSLTLYPEYEYKGYAWGMAIDLSSCTGCNACVIACQSENNIPVVGKEQVMVNREMHWLRIDRYFEGNVENPQTHFQPVLCMHCEQAPCEVVCPVTATAHSSEGLNDMVYNRCVGTRYCSNNCPYKVRRFNFLQYSDYNTESLKAMRNPDVTVRSRGVMEKCTYCVQRINYARIEAEKEDRKVQDGEIVTACQAACPAEAIVFGDINDPGSRVTKLKAQERNYSLLGELNTRPRTTYLASLRNTNPELGKDESHGSKDEGHS
jgi:MoCo/4Fe-4S cofactor protein with predicted Tat translocation signal